jgi:hypothetical protein
MLKFTMLFVRFDGKEIPFATRFQDPQYLAFLEHLADENEKSIKKRNERITLVATVLGVAISLFAAVAAFWASSEAHATRIEDERPFVGVELAPPNAPPDEINKTAIMRSFGKTPALKVSSVCLLSPTEENVHWKNLDSVKDSKIFQFDKVDSFPYMLPNQQELIECPESLAPQQPVIDRTLFTIYGRVKYKSMNGYEYETPFCLTRYKSLTSDGTKVRSCNEVAEPFPALR